MKLYKIQKQLEIESHITWRKSVTEKGQEMNSLIEEYKTRITMLCQEWEIKSLEIQQLENEVLMTDHLDEKQEIPQSFLLNLQQNQAKLSRFLFSFFSSFFFFFFFLLV